MQIDSGLNLRHMQVFMRDVVEVSLNIADGIMRTRTPEDVGGNKTSECSGSLTGGSILVFCCCDAQSQDGHRQTQEKLHSLKAKSSHRKNTRCWKAMAEYSLYFGMEEVTFLKSELSYFE